MSDRVRSLALVVAATLSASLAGGVLAADKVPGDQVVTLRLGTSEHPGGPDDPLLEVFADRAEELSDGAIRVELLHGLADDANDFEQKIIRMVQDGELELGTSAARAFDVLGVQGFQALQAPFLVTDYELLRQIMSSPIPREMLAGLEAIDLVGLGLYPGLLRHPVGYARPLASLEDLEGARIRVPTSDASDATWRALGAEPLHLNGFAFDEARVSGLLDGIDAPMGSVPQVEGSYATSNVTLYPRTITIFLSARAASALSDEHLDVLRTAAAESLDYSLSALPLTDDPQPFCDGGGFVVAGEPAEVEAMIAATLPVRSTMEQDPATRAFIQRIEAIKAGTPAAPASAATCGGETVEATAVVDPFPAGTYTTIASRQDALRTGVPDECALQSDGLHLKLVVGAGQYHLFGRCERYPEESSFDIGTYTATTDTIDMGPRCCPGQSTIYDWTLDGDTLTLVITDETNSPPGDIPFNHFLYEHEWTSQ